MKYREERADDGADHSGPARHPADQRPEHAQQPLRRLPLGQDEPGQREERDGWQMRLGRQVVGVQRHRRRVERAISPPTSISMTTMSIADQASSAETVAPTVAANPCATCRAVPSAMKVAVASAISLFWRAARPTPRKPTHRVRCCTNGMDPGMPLPVAVVAGWKTGPAADRGGMGTGRSRRAGRPGLSVGRRDTSLDPERRQGPARRTVAGEPRPAERLRHTRHRREHPRVVRRLARARLLRAFAGAQSGRSPTRTAARLARGIVAARRHHQPGGGPQQARPVVPLLVAAT